MIKHIATCVESKMTSSGWAIGTNMFAGWRPDRAPERCILIQETGGGKANYQNPDMVEILVNVITRSDTYHTARTDAWEVFWALEGGGCCSDWSFFTASDYNDFMATEIEALAPPQYIGQDAKGLFEFSTNYIWRIENPT